jgi:RNA polymerase sigma-70 factor (ECF subfamily)
MVDVEDMRHQLDYDQILSDYSYEDLLKMIAELPTGSRIVFNMYAIDGYSHKEIAEKLGISIGTSKSQYSRAKTLLQKKISEEESKNYEKIKR